MRRRIGGRTVAEACRRLTYNELLDWAAYRDVVVDERVRAAKSKKRVIDW